MMEKDTTDDSKHSENFFNDEELKEGFDDEDIIIPRPVDKKKKVGPLKKITITFRENRTFELNLGHEVMRFVGRETKTVDASILKHPAFKQARKDFNIKGV